MKIKSIDIENNLFITDDDLEYPLMDTDISLEELNFVFEKSKEAVNEMLSKLYGEVA